MKRRDFIGTATLAGFAGLVPGAGNSETIAQQNELDLDRRKDSDRKYWMHLLDKISDPVLSNMSQGKLHQNMPMEVSPKWDNRDIRVGYLEGFGRLLSGIAPFLELENISDPKEKKIQERLRAQAQQSIAHATDPKSPDYLYWGPRAAQPLVDAAFFAQGLIYAPNALWKDLPTSVKANVVTAFKTVRKIKPFNNNWVLFAAICESFLLSIGEDIVPERIDNAIDLIMSWYLGDGWYGDGPMFHLDYYNGYVIQPMLTEVLKINAAEGRREMKEFELAYKRMKRFGAQQERLISPEGTYPILGRSSTYRAGAFWPLAKLSLDKELPKDVAPEQVRCALTAVLKKTFVPKTFKNGWLTLGLVGDQQTNIADSYSNTGSMYLTSLVFLPLGLPAEDTFWSGPDKDWTAKRAWSGEEFPIDHAINY